MYELKYRNNGKRGKLTILYKVFKATQLLVKTMMSVGNGVQSLF